MLKQQISIWYQRSTDRNKWELLQPNPPMPIWVQNKKGRISANSAELPLPLRTIWTHPEDILQEKAEKFSICLRTWATNSCVLFLEGVGAGGEGDGDSPDRTSRIGAWFAEILEELIQFVVVCLCLSLSGTSFTDIPVYCWQLLLNKIIFSLPSRSFSYFWRFCG